MFDGIATLVSTVVDKIWPDADIEARAKAEALKTQLTMELQSTLGQLEINKAEAASPSVFVAGWRPAVGWGVALGYAYAFVLAPIANGLLLAFGSPVHLPTPDGEMLRELLYSLLGVAGFRTIEKINRVAR